jgi:hypothetical protein
MRKVPRTILWAPAKKVSAENGHQEVRQEASVLLQEALTVRCIQILKTEKRNARKTPDDQERRALLEANPSATLPVSGRKVITCQEVDRC